MPVVRYTDPMRFPREGVYWYTLKKPSIQRLETNCTVDAVIVGGGVTGLTCAQYLCERGWQVALLEKDFCGAGASGKTSGFITPDSELELSDLVINYGEQRGKQLWEFAKHGVELIRQNIHKFHLKCDYQIQDSLFIANSARKYPVIQQEHNTQHRCGYASKLYTKESVTEIIGSKQYWGAVRNSNTFGMNSYLYCQGMKEVLQKQGVAIYEGTQVSQIHERGVEARGYKVTAKKVVVCVDRFLPQLGLAPQAVYNAQAFLSVSKPLTDTAMRAIFPKEKFMVWDTDLIYHYFRATGDNRLVIGAANILLTYWPWEYHHYHLIVRKMYSYMRHKFPHLNLELEYVWPGLIGVTKDFIPIAGQLASAPKVFVASAAAGLPWSAAIGAYLGEAIIEGRDDLNDVLSPQRQFRIKKAWHAFIGKPLAFAVSHGIAKYFHK